MATTRLIPRRKKTASGTQSAPAEGVALDLETCPADGEVLEPSWPRRVLIAFDESLLDQDALKVVRRLVRNGYEAYLVGGGVRDLLLGRRPKDFDVATQARPEQVRSLFRNSRVIGRRFRLVHVLFSDRKVIEVATFRRSPHSSEDSPPSDDLLIRSDNAFGEAHEDAARRDLTINALFYDVDRKQVIDFVGGLADIENHVVRTIGDPVVRFREDPIRMIRAIKFAARLDLGIAPEVYDAIVLCRDCMASAARPRLLEELLKVLRSGAARRAFWLAWETGLLHVVLPELATLLDDDVSESGAAVHVWRMLGELDRRTLVRGRPMEDVALMTTLLLEPIRECFGGRADRATLARQGFEALAQRLAVPRRMTDEICRIAAIMPRVAAGRAGRLARTELFLLASELVSIDQAADATPDP